VKQFILALGLLLASFGALADCVVTASNGKQLNLCNSTQTFAFSGGNLSTITVVYQGITYIQTFTYSGDTIATISPFIAQS
jgi:hypothetical protein